MHRHFLPGIALVCALLSAAHTQAADAPPLGAPITSADGAVVTYDRSYFAQFSGATTAEDLISRIPGIQDLLVPPPTNSNTVEQRGFGSSGSPLLFNGRCLSGKTNSPLDALKRIQARQVVSVSVIRGSVPGLDVRIGNEGYVVNIVLEETLSASYGAWEANAVYNQSGRWRPGAKLSYAGDFGPIGYILSGEIEPRFNARYTHDTYVLPPNTLAFGGIRLKNIETGTYYTGTASVSYGLANGDIANLNGRYNNEGRTANQPLNSYTVNAARAEVYTGSTLLIQDRHGDVEWEVGGDYEHGFDSGDSLRALFVVTSDKRPLVTDLFTTPLNVATIHSQLQTVQSDRTERIARGYYNWVINPKHALEVGAEVAFNALDQRNRQFQDSAGALVPVALFNADSKVKETRFETFARYSWQVSADLYAEGSLDTETSSLKQRGIDVSTDRSFFFIKPRLDLRYQLAPRSKINARFFRTISQLDFANFVSSISSSDVRFGVVQAGNPSLVPEKTWTAEGTFEQRLARDQGTGSLRVFYNDISDAIDKILIAPDIAGFGNVGHAHSYGTELKVGLRLGWLGLPGAVIDASGTLQHSSVPDGFTPPHHPLQNFEDHFWSVSFRHDTKWHNLAYGATLNGHAARFGSDIDYTHAFLFHPEATAFAEMRAAGLTYRIEGQRLLGVVTRDRYQYIGNRAANNLRRLELRYDTFDTTVKFIVKGTF